MPVVRQEPSDPYRAADADEDHPRDADSPNQDCVAALVANGAHVVLPAGFEVETAVPGGHRDVAGV